MKIKHLSLALLLTGGLIMAGCGSSSDSSDSATTSVQEYTGNIIDSPVDGLDYICINTNGKIISSGTTDSLGTFKYTSDTFNCRYGVESNGTFVSFGLIAPISMEYAPNKILYFPSSKAFILQSLDNDGNLDNGIQITPEEKAVIVQNFSDTDFASMTDASTLVSTLQSNDTNYSGREYNLSEAITNIFAEMQNVIDPGTYKGTFTLTKGDTANCLQKGEVTMEVNTSGNNIIISGYVTDGIENYTLNGSFDGMLTGVVNDADNTAWYGFYTSDHKFGGYYKSAYCEGKWEVTLQ